MDEKTTETRSTPASKGWSASSMARATGTVSSEPPEANEPAAPPGGAGSIDLCLCLGLVCAGVGLYFLLVAPGNPDAVSSLEGGAQIVNLQRLAIGQALTVSGAVFLAVALKPR
jgi:hypothetical protein